MANSIKIPVTETIVTDRELVLPAFRVRRFTHVNPVYYAIFDDKNALRISIGDAYSQKVAEVNTYSPASVMEAFTNADYEECSAQEFYSAMLQAYDKYFAILNQTK